MPCRTTLDPNELKLFSRLGRKDRDVGLKLGDDLDGNVVVIKSVGQAAAKGIKEGYIVSCFDDVKLVPGLHTAAQVTEEYNLKVQGVDHFSITFNCDERVREQLRKRSEVIKLMEEL